MKIPSIITSIGEKTFNLVRKTNATKTPELVSDVVEISTKTKLTSGIKKLLLGLDKKTIKQLEKLPIEDFFVKSQTIVMKALDIPEEIAPWQKIEDLKNPKFGMKYLPSFNAIIINETALKKNKALLFSLIRHEMEHFRQNTLIFRIEKLGEQAVKAYSEEAKSKLSIDTFDDLNNLRKKVIEKYGMIKADSEEAQTAKKYFEEMLVQNVAINKEYFDRQIEQEAIAAQYVVKYEYLFKKFFG